MAPLSSTVSFVFNGVPVILEGIDGSCFDYRQTGILTVIIEDVLLPSTLFQHRKIPGKIPALFI